MTIEVMTVITVVSICIGAYSTLRSILKDRDRESKKSQTEVTSMIFELKSISNGIVKIEEKLNNIERDEKDSKERIIILEQNMNSVWKKIEEMNEQINLLKNIP